MAWLSVERAWEMAVAAHEESRRAELAAAEAIEAAGDAKMAESRAWGRERECWARVAAMLEKEG